MPFKEFHGSGRSLLSVTRFAPVPKDKDLPSRMFKRSKSDLPTLHSCQAARRICSPSRKYLGRVWERFDSHLISSASLFLIKVTWNTIVHLDRCREPHACPLQLPTASIINLRIPSLLLNYKTQWWSQPAKEARLEIHDACLLGSPVPRTLVCWRWQPELLSVPP